MIEATVLLVPSGKTVVPSRAPRVLPGHGCHAPGILWRIPLSLRLPCGPLRFIMFFVYILRSTATGRYYYGHTKDLSKRIKQHNSGKVRSTKAYRPWEVNLCRGIFNQKLKHIIGEMFFQNDQKGSANLAIIQRNNLQKEQS